MTDDLERLLAWARARGATMTPEQIEAMKQEQREGNAKATASRPQPKYRWVNGVKVYASYEDYCND